MNITLHDKSLEIRLTAAAQKALARRDRPLVAEMELLFSCLLRKRVYFGESPEQSTPVNDRLWVRFKPIMTRRCTSCASVLRELFCARPSKVHAAC